MAKPRILLADDHGLILEGLRSLLQQNFDIVATASNGQQLVEYASQLKPDAVLIDVSMPILNGIEAARQIRNFDPHIKLLFVSQKSDREYVYAAMRLGASGYLLKESAVGELEIALREVLAGRYYFSPSLRGSGISDAFYSPQRNPPKLFGHNLTRRQREVLQLVAEGKANKEVAAILHISVKTVDFHKAGLMAELGLRTTAELTRYAIQHGIVGG